MGLMACSGEEAGEVSQPEVGTPIAFSANQDEKAMVTRATSLHDEDIDAFTVWGYKNMDAEYTASGLQAVIPGYTVNWQGNSTNTTTTNSSGWEYILTSKPDQTIKYWDWSATAYRFFAVTDGTYEDNETNGTFEISITATDEATTPYFSALWFSTGQLPTYSDKQFGKPVQLVFMKPFSKVRFMFTYASPREGVVMGSKSFKPKDGSGIAQTGTVTISYPLTGAATKESFSVTASSELTDFTEDYDPDDDNKSYSETDEGWYTVLPNNSQDSYTLTVNLNGVDKTAVVPASYMQWLPGYSYTYIFKINEEGGVEIDMVQAAFSTTPWIELSGDPKVYNW